MEYAGNTRVHDDTGAEIDATFSVEVQPDGIPSIVFKSRSGRSGQGAGRNTDCKRGLQRILERFAVAGFTINAVFLDTTVTRRKYFALLASPDRFDIRAASAALATDYWIVPRPTAKRGDRIIVWQPMDKDRRRGVVAFGEVTEPATERGPDPAETRFWKSGSSRPDIALRIRVW